MKNNENRRTIEKETEVEDSYGKCSLSFRVDQMTLAQRRDLSQRQKHLADTNMEAEIQCFMKMLKVLS